MRQSAWSIIITVRVCHQRSQGSALESSQQGNEQGHGDYKSPVSVQSKQEIRSKITTYPRHSLIESALGLSTLFVIPERDDSHNASIHSLLPSLASVKENKKLWIALRMAVRACIKKEDVMVNLILVGDDGQARTRIPRREKEVVGNSVFESDRQASIRCPPA